jgi:hypothetical protein
MEAPLQGLGPSQSVTVKKAKGAVCCGTEGVKPQERAVGGVWHSFT